MGVTAARPAVAPMYPLPKGAREPLAPTPPRPALLRVVFPRLPKDGRGRLPAVPPRSGEPARIRPHVRAVGVSGNFPFPPLLVFLRGCRLPLLTQEAGGSGGCV